MGQRRNEKRNKKFMETNENPDTTFQNMLDTTKAVLWGKLIAIDAYIKAQERHQVQEETSHLQEQEKQRKNVPQNHRKQEINISREEINHIKLKKNDTKSTNQKAGLSGI